MARWLVKSEPSVYSIEDLERDGKTYWDGVRNYQARNFIRAMKKGDIVLFYHSNAEPPGVAGAARVAQEAYPDFTAWDKTDDHYDAKSKKETPVWFMADLAFVEKWPLVPLETLKAQASLKGMELLRRGSRLSVQPVSEVHFDAVRRLAKKGS